MARKKKKNQAKAPPLQLPKVQLEVKPETARSIYIIGTVILSLLFILAPFRLGGNVGNFLYEQLVNLFGMGYWLLPVSLLFLAVGLSRRHEHEGVGAGRAVGALVLFLAGVGILSLTTPEAGGIVGALIKAPFVSLFDTLLGGVMLGALAVVGTLLALDTPLSLALLMRKKRAEDTEKVEEPYEDAFDEDEEEEKEEDDASDEEAAEPEVKVAVPEPSRSIPTTRFMASDQEYTPPPLSLLERDKGKPGVGDVKANANIIKRTLHNFGITVEMDEISIGPTVTRFALKPAEGVRLQKILALQNNLELALAASPVRIEAPIPGKSLVGIEVPNLKKATVGLASLLSEKVFMDDARPLLAALGRDITGVPHFTNIAKMPHILIAGATGSGKSVSIHALITSLLYRNGPGTLRFMMVDPKRVELTPYNSIPHLLTPVITDPKKAILGLKWAGKEMERRYELLQSHSVRDIHSYHETIAKAGNVSREDGDAEPVDQMPYIVIVIDELADIMQSYPRELEAAVVRLAQMSRAVGIHLVLSTQRPSVNVVTGLIKANIPARIALQVASQIDSKTILDMAGAEKLLGAGDMLYLSGDMAKPHRIQTAFISEEEVKNIVSFIKKNNESSLDEISLTGNAAPDSPNAIFSASLEDGDIDDDLFAEAKQTVEAAGKASTSLLQRKLRIGYARAARLMDVLEERGIIGPQDGAKPRDVLTAAAGGAAARGTYDEENSE